jgi:hypothetical protein
MSLNCLTRPGTKTENLPKTKKQKKNKHHSKFGPKSRQLRSPKHFWKGGKQEMEKLIKYVKEIGFFDGI